MSANLPADISSPVVFAQHLAQHGFDLSCSTNVQVLLPSIEELCNSPPQLSEFLFENLLNAAFVGANYMGEFLKMKYKLKAGF